MCNATRRDLHSSSSAIVSVEGNGVIGALFSRSCAKGDWWGPKFGRQIF